MAAAEAVLRVEDDGERGDIGQEGKWEYRSPHNTTIKTPPVQVTRDEYIKEYTHLPSTCQRGHDRW